MPTSLPTKRGGEYRRSADTEDLERGLYGATVIVAVAFCVLSWLVEARFLLPAMSLVVLACGLGLGAISVQRGWLGSRGREALLNVAGALTLFGFAAAIVSDKADAAAFLALLLGA